jgi:uncharacterized membrane protein
MAFKRLAAVLALALIGTGPGVFANEEPNELDKVRRLGGGGKRGGGGARGGGARGGSSGGGWSGGGWGGGGQGKDYVCVVLLECPTEQM